LGFEVCLKLDSPYDNNARDNCTQASRTNRSPEAIEVKWVAKVLSLEVKGVVLLDDEMALTFGIVYLCGRM